MHARTLDARIATGLHRRPNHIVKKLHTECLMNKWIVTFTAVICSACTPVKTFKPYGEAYPPSNEAVKVVPMTARPDSQCVRIGEIHVFDSGFSLGCGYEEVLSRAVKETSKRGGNAFHITRVSAPHFWDSTCYRIRGEALQCK